MKPGSQDSHDIGRLIRESRTGLRLSPNQLARAASCSRATIRTFEAGLIPKQSEVLPRILNALKVLEQARQEHPGQDPVEALIADLQQLQRVRSEETKS